MELRKPFRERVYVEDDLPSFIRKGPALHRIPQPGKPESFAPLPPDPIHDVTLSNGYRSSDRYLKAPTSDGLASTKAVSTSLPALKNWDSRFLLTAVGIIVSLNAILYISFHPISERTQLQRIGGRSALIKNNAAPIAPLEDRIVTLRFTSSSYTEEPAPITKETETKPYLSILQQP